MSADQLLDLIEDLARRSEFSETVVHLSPRQAGSAVAFLKQHAALRVKLETLRDKARALLDKLDEHLAHEWRRHLTPEAEALRALLPEQGTPKEAGS